MVVYQAGENWFINNISPMWSVKMDRVQCIFSMLLLGGPGIVLLICVAYSVWIGDSWIVSPTYTSGTFSLMPF